MHSGQERIELVELLLALCVSRGLVVLFNECFQVVSGNVRLNRAQQAGGQRDGAFLPPYWNHVLALDVGSVHPPGVLDLMAGTRFLRLRLLPLLKPRRRVEVNYAVLFPDGFIDVVEVGIHVANLPAEILRCKRIAHQTTMVGAHNGQEEIWKREIQQRLSLRSLTSRDRVDFIPEDQWIS